MKESQEIDDNSLPFSLSVAALVPEDLHSKWARISKFLTKNLYVISLITCQETTQGNYLQCELKDITRREIFILNDYKDIKDSMFFVKDGYLILRTSVLTL